ncbi:MAG TPA: energy transducer TonB [Candidatus Acidoferrales bacterium]|jgi:hypothetical protein|nr:energy transducer TonB [Candidatus Acidoferrales bacterium]
MPDQFTIGRHTFIDVGPPNDYYEILRVAPNANGSLVTKITLTPVTDICFTPAEIETVSGSLPSSPRDLLRSVNPCTIPQKELKSEWKRCKNCLVFSGVNITMQVQCGDQTRILRSKILDKDLFDANPHTPEHTSWTIELLNRLDQAVGPGVLDQPIFPGLANDKAPQGEVSPEALQDIRSGKYDSLFPGAPDKPSDLYRASQIPAAVPSVRLKSSEPFQPVSFTLPKYPPISKIAHVEGDVSVSLKIGTQGSVEDVAFDSGPPLLRGAVQKAVSNWKFPHEAAHTQVHATLAFSLNCPAKR